MNSLTCLIADDHPAVTESVKLMLERAGYSVVACVADGVEALAQLACCQPDFAVIDLQLPRLHGIEVLREAGQKAPRTQSIVYSAFGEPGQLADALDAGAAGFLLKDSPLDDLVRALPIIRSGELYIDPVLAGAWMKGRSQHTDPLTKREREILRLMADGLTNEEIGKQLFVAPETVRSHVRRAMLKMGTRTRVQLVASALRQSLIS